MSFFLLLLLLLLLSVEVVVVIESENLTVTDEFTSNYQTARDTFSIFYNKLDIDSIQLITSHYKQSELEDFLVKTCGMSSKRVENSIKKISYKNYTFLTKTYFVFF